MKVTRGETNNAIVTTLRNVRKHINADRLQMATVCGDTVIVDLKANEGDKVIYFDSNLCISLDYLKENNLFSSIALNKVPDKEKKGFFGKRGRVKPTNLRGEKSYGYVTSIEPVAKFCKATVEDFEDGLEFNTINGAVVCEKYIPPNVREKMASGSINKSKPLSTNMFPMHWQTKQFKRSLGFIPENRLLYIEEKEHGSSHRTSHVKYERDLKWYEKLLSKFVKIDKLDWIYMNGSRRVNLTKNPNSKSFYKGDMRENFLRKVEGQINKGEQLYLELSGYDTNGGWIQKQFPYGCEVGECLDTLYRVTINGEDGKTYDMGREFVYKRAEELGMHKPHLFEKYYYTGNMEELIEKVDSYTDGKSMIDNETLREGVVIWFEGHDGKWTCLKNKSFDFLNYESKIKDDEDFIDIEDIN